MADDTGIEWTDATWTPVRARVMEIQNDGSGKERIGWHCTHVSEGCRNCYAETLNRFRGTGRDYKPDELYREEHKGYRNGDVHVFLDEKMLSQPLHWSKPRRIFVCSMTDLFADFVTDGWIARVWDVMGKCPQHQFQILTKRPQRMREWGSRWADLAGEDFSDAKLVRGPKATRRAHPSGRGQLFAAMLESMGSPPPGAAYPTFDWMGGQMWWPTVLPNVWLGVSAEDQPRADERIHHLFDTPAAVRFVSLEPLLGPIDLTDLGGPGSAKSYGAHGWSAIWKENRIGRPCLDWVICGGESGANARPMHPDWARGLRDQCAAAGVPYFLKQWGNWAPVCEMSESEIDACYHAAPERHPEATRKCKVSTCVLHSDGQRFDRPENGAYAQDSGAMMMMDIGKKAAGSMLDGREHKAFPDG
jgi:protein gp37